MRFLTLVIMALIFIVGCENPGESNAEQTLYKGQQIQTEAAPFLKQTNSLAKDSDAYVLIDFSIAEGTVYGLIEDELVYAAVGGEGLPKGTWVDNLGSEPMQVSVSSGLVISFDTPTTVTLIDADHVIYVDENGMGVLFSGSGVITTSEISTGEEGSVTFISSTKFGIGGDGGEWG